MPIIITGGADPWAPGVKERQVDRGQPDSSVRSIFPPSGQDWHSLLNCVPGFTGCGFLDLHQRTSVDRI
jgi:hypothetical protein